MHRSPHTLRDSQLLYAHTWTCDTYKCARSNTALWQSSFPPPAPQKAFLPLCLTPCLPFASLAHTRTPFSSVRQWQAGTPVRDDNCSPDDATERRQEAIVRVDDTVSMCGSISPTHDRFSAENPLFAFPALRKPMFTKTKKKNLIYKSGLTHTWHLRLRKAHAVALLPKLWLTAWVRGGTPKLEGFRPRVQLSLTSSNACMCKFI